MAVVRGDHRDYVRGALCKHDIMQHVARGDLVLYGDSEGRTYAFPPESLGGVSPDAPVLDNGCAYVMFPSLRGLAYDATEEDLGGRATPPADSKVRVTARGGRRGAHARTDYPRALVVRVGDVYRHGMRSSAVMECTVTFT